MPLTKKCFIVTIVLSIAIIKCLLIQYTLAVGVSTYRVTETNRIFLRPNSSTTLKVHNLLNIKPHPSWPNAYIANFKHVNYDIQSVGTRLVTSLKNCNAFKKVYMALKLPFVIQKDKDGLFESIIVSKKDDKTSVNIKLLTAGIIQVNETAAKEKTGKTRASAPITTERYFFGECRMTYEGRAHPGLLKINVNYDKNKCKPNILDNVPDKAILSKFCNPSNKELKLQIRGEKSIFNKWNEIFFRSISERTSLSYKPLKDSENTIQMDIQEDVRSVDPVRGETGPNFNESETETVTQFKHTTVVKEYVTNARDEVRQVYKGLACGGNHFSLLLALHEYAIVCRK